MSRFTAYDSDLQAIMNYPNVRGLLGRTPIKSRQSDARHLRTESFEFRTELEKYAQELGEPQINDKTVDNSQGPKRARDASPASEDESIVEPSPKKQKTEVEDDDATLLDRDNYSIWDAMLWGSSFPGTTDALSPSSPQRSQQALPEIGDSSSDAALNIPESWNFTIFKDPDAGTDDYSMAGCEAPWIPEYEDENKENDPPEFDVATEEADEVFEPNGYDNYVWQRQFPRSVLGELQRN